MRGARALAMLAAVAALAPVAALAAGCGHSGATSEAGGDAGAPDGAGDAAGPTGVGLVTFSGSPDGGGTFFAGFSDPAPPPPTHCTYVDAGACVTASCTAVAASDAGVPPAPTAGTLTLTGGVFGAGTPMSPEANGTYSYASAATLFAAGDTLGVSAAGGTIPAFPRQTVVAPGPIDLTAPAPTGGTITIVTTQPLTVSWTGGQAGDQAFLTATALFTSGNLASLTCAWDAAAGTATVPSVALKPLAAANAWSSGISWFQAAQTTFPAGPVSVTLSAYVAQGSLAAFQ